MKRFLILLTTTQLIHFGVSKITPIIDESLEECVKPAEKAGYFDIKDLEIIAESETSSVLNGIWRFTKGINSPWTCVAYTERFERGQWNMYAMKRQIVDFCKQMLIPAEPWYNMFKNVSQCPLKPGVSLLIIKNNL